YNQAKKQFRIMERMIGDILQAAKGQNSELQIQPHKLYLNVLCENILKQFTSQFLSKSFLVKKDLPQDLPAIYADEELINQVLVNLLENAIKYTPEGGTISISILHRTAQKIQLSVCDTGPGIPPEQQELIFQRNFRLKRDRAKEGYGIGLSLCSQVIRAHYGQIWVNSNLGEGSCFHFTLPVYRL
ncbi:MAG: histidine kinase, partial [Okeania sp. SIO2D1]|nr:histidine kinase [Okeania sp. SIO2D1]